MIEKVSEKKTHKISDWNHVIYAKIHDYILNEPGDKKKQNVMYSMLLFYQ